MRRKLLSLFLLVALIAGMSTLITANEQSIMSLEEYWASDIFQENVQQFMDSAEVSREFAENFLRTRNITDSFFDMLPTDRIGNVIFPNNFGGMYINDEGLLVIQVTSNEMLRNLMSDDFLTLIDMNYVEIEIVEFSRFELEEVRDYLDDFVLSKMNGNFLRDDVTLIFKSISIDVIQNRVWVGLYCYSPDSINAFKENVIDSPMIIFGQHRFRSFPVFDEAMMELGIEENVVDSLDYIGIVPLRPPLNPGDAVGGGSIGFRAVDRNGNNGFVTAAHLFRPGASVAGPHGLYGTASTRDWHLGGRVDAVFVVLRTPAPGEAPVQISNNLPCGRQLQGYQFRNPNNIIGDQVAKVGITGRATGTIADDDYRTFVTCPVNHTTTRLVGLIRANSGGSSGGSRPGDSGGVVYYTDDRTIAGIIVTGSPGVDMVFAYAGAIRDILQLTF